MLLNCISEHLIFKNFPGGMLLDPLADLCLHTVECALHTIVLLFVPIMVDQSIFEMANPVLKITGGSWSVIHSK